MALKDLPNIKAQIEQALVLLQLPAKTDLKGPKDESLKAIKTAYRAQALLTHPDKNGGSNEKFVEVGEAFALLADLVKNPHKQNEATKRAEFNNNFNFSNPGSADNVDDFINNVEAKVEELFSMVDALFTKVDTLFPSAGDDYNPLTHPFKIGYTVKAPHFFSKTGKGKELQLFEFSCEDFFVQLFPPVRKDIEEFTLHSETNFPPKGKEAFIRLLERLPNLRVFNYPKNMFTSDELKKINVISNKNKINYWKKQFTLMCKKAPWFLFAFALAAAYYFYGAPFAWIPLFKSIGFGVVGFLIGEGRNYLLAECAVYCKQEVCSKLDTISQDEREAILVGLEAKNYKGYLLSFINLNACKHPILTAGFMQAAITEPQDAIDEVKRRLPNRP